MKVTSYATRWASILIACILIIGQPAFDLSNIEAKGGGRSGGFSSSRSSGGFSSSRSSSSSSSGSRSSGWGSSSKSSKPVPTPPQTVKKPTLTPAQQKMKAAATKQGTVFKSPSEARTAFSKKYGDQYKSTYASKPATRPSHIPESTSVNGKSYNVTYNVNHGGYGYYGPSGSWIMYDAMRDAAMLGVLMNSHNYYVPPTGGSVVVHERSGSAIIVGILFCTVVVCGIVFVIAKV